MSVADGWNEPGLDLMLCRLRADAMNAKIWQKSKLHVVEASVTFGLGISNASSWETVQADLDHKKLLCDMQVIKGTGTSLGMVGMIKHQMDSLKLPSFADGTPVLALADDAALAAQLAIAGPAAPPPPGPAAPPPPAPPFAEVPAASADVEMEDAALEQLQQLLGGAPTAGFCFFICYHYYIAVWECFHC